MKCLYCDRDVSPRGMSSHVRAAHLGSNHHRSRQPWNKGLNKASDSRLCEAAEKLSKSTKGRPGRIIPKEERDKLSAFRKAYYLQHPEEHPNRKVAGNRTKMTYPERRCFDWLEKNGVMFEHQFRFNSWFIDFRVGNTLIEIDGEYWHRDKERDAARDAILIDAGYNVIRIKAKENIEERLQEYLGIGELG